jgi:Zn-dependent protease with chaperone function
MNKLLDVDKRFKRIIGKKNQVVVIRNPTQNAFSLPNKRLLIYSGLIESCLNNHDLSVVLSHEIAH